MTTQVEILVGVSEETYALLTAISESGIDRDKFLESAIALKAIQVTGLPKNIKTQASRLYLNGVLGEV